MPRPRTSRLATGALLALAARPALADDVPPEFTKQFNELARAAEAALRAEGPDAAIRLYEEGLLGPLGEYGRISLRLGQIYQQAGRSADAAAHYRACQDDPRVDAVDREMICRDGFDAVTAPLAIDGLPPRARVVVVEPARFAGPWREGARLPLGPARLVVDAPGRQRAEAEVQVAAPETRWAAVVGPPIESVMQLPVVVSPPADEEPSGAGGSPWPAFVLGGVGLGLVGGGLYLGFGSHGALDDARARQADGGCGADHCRGELDDAAGRAKLADGLWIGGAVVAAAGLVWYLLDDGDAE